MLCHLRFRKYEDIWYIFKDKKIYQVVCISSFMTLTLPYKVDRKSREKITGAQLFLTRSQFQKAREDYGHTIETTIIYDSKGCREHPLKQSNCYF